MLHTLVIHPPSRVLRATLLLRRILISWEFWYDPSTTNHRTTPFFHRNRPETYKRGQRGLTRDGILWAKETLLRPNMFGWAKRTLFTAKLLQGGLLTGAADMRFDAFRSDMYNLCVL